MYNIYILIQKCSLILKNIFFYFTVEPAIAKKQISDEECAQLMKNITNERPDIMEGMKATDNQHLRFLEFTAISSYLKKQKKTLLCNF